MNIVKEIWSDQNGLSPLVVTMILVAVGAIMALGAVNLLSPKIRDTTEGAGDVMDDAASFTF